MINELLEINYYMNINVYQQFSIKLKLINITLNKNFLLILCLFLKINYDVNISKNWKFLIKFYFNKIFNILNITFKEFINLVI